MSNAVSVSRFAEIVRTTKETEIRIGVDLDRCGQIDIVTALPFLSHMLEALATHGRFNLSVQAHGDIEVDPHHLLEDTGIVLGAAIFKALGGLAGLQRAGCFSFPMDGTLANVAVDLCGRPNLVWHVKFGTFEVGHLNPNLWREFFKGFVDGLKATVHISVPYSDNDHHAIEAIFKALARSLTQAVQLIHGDQFLSTKGLLGDGEYG